MSGISYIPIFSRVILVSSCPYRPLVRESKEREYLVLLSPLTDTAKARHDIHNEYLHLEKESAMNWLPLPILCSIRLHKVTPSVGDLKMRY